MRNRRLRSHIDKKVSIGERTRVAAAEGPICAAVPHDSCGRKYVASERLFAEIEEIGTSENYGLVHADLTFNNCLLHQGQLNVIDFADSRYTSHYYDIAVPLTDLTEYWHIDHQDYEMLQAAFYDGYSTVRP